MPVLRQIRERFERERPLDGVIDGLLPARHDGDGEPRAHADGRRRRRRALRVEPALHAGRRPPPRWSTATALRSSRSTARTTTPTTRHIQTAVERRPADHDGRRRRRRRAFSTASGPTCSRACPRRHRGDDDRRDPAEGARGRGQARLSDRRRERRLHQALLRQPLRHRPVDLDGVIRATNALIAGCGSSSSATAGAARASRCGRRATAPTSSSARSILCARSRRVMDGFEVMPSVEAAEVGDVFISVTGDRDAIDGRDVRRHEVRRDHRQLGSLRRRDQQGRPRRDHRGEVRGAAVRRGSPHRRTGERSSCSPTAGS